MPANIALIVARLIINISNIYLLGVRVKRTGIGALMQKIYQDICLDF